jgi:hypothetical protein
MNKNIGHFEKILAVDCETTGLCFNSNDPVTDGKERHQSLSWGALIVDADTLKVEDELYVEIKWNEESYIQRYKDPKFGIGAEKVHGMTESYLAQNGVDEEEAVQQLGTLICENLDIKKRIRLLGHNVVFDSYFLHDLFHRHGIDLLFGTKFIDTSSIAYATMGIFNSDAMFDALGMQERGAHNALEDIKMTLETVKMIRGLWQYGVGIP